MATGNFIRLTDYPHVPLMLAGRSQPIDVLRQINASAKSQDYVAIDQNFLAVVDTYQACERTQREDMRATVTHRWSLLHFTHRMTVRLLTTCDARDLDRALLALSLEDLRSDPRETQAGFVMAHYAAGKTGIDWDRAFQSVLSISSTPFADYLREYVLRSPNPVCLLDYAIRHSSGEDGDTFEIIV